MSEKAPRTGQPVEYPAIPTERDPDYFEHVAESCEQGEIIRVLRSSLYRLIRMRGWSRVMAGADNYFAWDPRQPRVRVSPDVYLLDDPPEVLPRMWRTWLSGQPPPRWAVEIVSEDWRKDYEENPPKYEALGCRELVIFDPEAARGATRNRRRSALTVYRRDEAGRLARAYAGKGPAYSEELGVWLIVPRPQAYVVEVRLSEDEAGERLVPTVEEWADGQAARAERDAEQAKREKHRAQREAARAEREAAKVQRESAKAKQEAARADREAAEARRQAALAEQEAARADSERRGRLEAEQRLQELERTLSRERGKKR